MKNKLFDLNFLVLSLLLFHSCEMHENNDGHERIPPIGIWNKFSTVKGNVFDMAMNGNTIYAATDSGFYMSADNANTWTNIAPSIIAASFSGSVICIINDTLMFVGTKSGLYKSNNGGYSWIFCNSLPEENVNAIIKDYDGNLWAALHIDGGAFFSDDLGDSWRPVIISTSPYFYELPQQFEALPNKMVFLGGANSLYVKNNTDTTWTDLHISSGYFDFALTRTIKHMQDSLILACAWHVGDFLYSLNLGRTWARCRIDSFLWYPTAVTDILNLDSVFLASGLGDGIYVSRNSGIDWSIMSDSLEVDDKDLWSLLTIGDYVIAGSQKGTIYRYRYR